MTTLGQATNKYAPPPPHPSAAPFSCLAGRGSDPGGAPLHAGVTSSARGRWQFEGQPLPVQHQGRCRLLHRGWLVFGRGGWLGGVVVGVIPLTRALGSRRGAFVLQRSLVFHLDEDDRVKNAGNTLSEASGPGHYRKKKHPCAAFPFRLNRTLRKNDRAHPSCKQARRCCRFSVGGGVGDSVGCW